MQNNIFTQYISELHESNKTKFIFFRSTNFTRSLHNIHKLPKMLNLDNRHHSSHRQVGQGGQVASPVRVKADCLP